MHHLLGMKNDIWSCCKNTQILPESNNIGHLIKHFPFSSSVNGYTNVIISKMCHKILRCESDILIVYMFLSMD